MSKVADLHAQILELSDEGLKPVSISGVLGVPLEMVYDVLEAEEIGEPYDDSMDGDFDSAMASAGLGTDEDYGYFGDNE
jgi:hypothetical protein